MNNYILSSIFIILIFLYYVLIGKFFLTKIEIKKNKFAVYLIVGWIITFALGWIVAFPIQLYSKSWWLFARIYTFLLIALGLTSLLVNIVLNKYRVKSYLEKLKHNPKIIFIKLLNHLKKYWLIYLFVVLFTLLSVTNLQSYTLNNYTDDHYIVKMVENYKASKLLTRDVTYGNFLYSYGKFGYAKQFSHRIFNTYEIIYTYFAAISHISMVTFARLTMTIHNYLIFFFSYQLIGSIFFEEEVSQYSIIFLMLLIFPEGYAARGMHLLKIRIFENWRNQTAIYMGGSIVRNTTFPLLLYFSYLFIRNKSIKSFTLFPILFITLLSYQTTVISYFILYFPVFMMILLLNYIWKGIGIIKDSTNTILIKCALSSLVVLGILVVLISFESLLKGINIKSSSSLLKMSVNWFTLAKGINIDSLDKLYKAYLPYYKNVFELDTFARIAPILFILLLMISKNCMERIITIAFLFLYIVFKSNIFKYLLSFVSFEFFGTARILNSVILLVVIALGIVLTRLTCLICEKVHFSSEYLNKIFLNKALMTSIIPIIIISTVVCCLKVNTAKIVKYNKSGDGVIKEGYSIMPLTNNDKMLSNIFVNIGKYFDSLPGKNFQVFSLDKLKYKGYYYNKQSLLLSSSKISLSDINWYTYGEAQKYNDLKTMNHLKTQNSANWWLDEVLVGPHWKNRYDLAKKYIDKSDILYAVITDKKQKNLLCINGWKIAYTDKSNSYWVLKRK